MSHSSAIPILRRPALGVPTASNPASTNTSPRLATASKTVSPTLPLLSSRVAYRGGRGHEGNRIACGGPRCGQSLGCWRTNDVLTISPPLPSRPRPSTERWCADLISVRLPHLSTQPQLTPLASQVIGPVCFRFNDTLCTRSCRPRRRWKQWTKSGHGSRRAGICPEARRDVRTPPSLCSSARADGRP